MSQRIIQKSCHNKIKYKNFTEVNLAGLKQMKINGSPQLYFYLCKNNHWHLTKSKTKYKVI